MLYGYYQLVRFVVMVAFAVMAYNYCKEKKEVLMVVFGALALLFQPFFKVALGCTIWNIVDIIVAIGLIVLFFYEMKREKGR